MFAKLNEKFNKSKIGKFFKLEGETNVYLFMDGFFVDIPPQIISSSM